MSSSATNERKRIAFVGAGFASAVLARELADSGRFHCTLFEERDHIAGNCHTERDSETNVMVHKYGPHLFHTDREDVWKYVNRFGAFEPYQHRVKAVTARGFFSLPVNLKTMREFFKKDFTPTEAEAFLKTQADTNIREPKNFEEQALASLGKDLYENFFYGYTKKQWGMEPRELPASILKRLPIRFSENENYFSDPYEGLPRLGYTKLVDRLLDHPAIEVHLSRSFHSDDATNFAHLFYSGPLDRYFDFKLGHLQYRTLQFERFRVQGGDFQKHSVVNYCEEKIPYTRIHEHKYFSPWETKEMRDSVYFEERSALAKPSDTPFYPLRLAQDKKLLGDYVNLAEAAKDKVTFIGRLGTYRYLDMHQVIAESLDLSKKCLINTDSESWPRFSVRPVD